MDEEHHEKTKQEDAKKEAHAKSKLDGPHFFRIRFHESYASLVEQIEQTKIRLLDIISERGVEKVKWVENQFNVEETLESYTKTIVISISRKTSVTSLHDFPLQISQIYTQIPDLNLIYLTGNTGTVAGAFIVQPNEWIGVGTGNLRHQGKPTPEHQILLSGSTFHRGTVNILYSKDLKALKK